MRPWKSILLFATIFMPLSELAAGQDNADPGAPPAQTASEKTGDPAQCLAFARDIDADLGEVLRAGCEPTLAQMSRLMDNPLGNVAMLFTQFDMYKMENPRFNEDANKYVNEPYENGWSLEA